MKRPPLLLMLLLLLLPVPPQVLANSTVPRAYVRKCCKADMAFYDNKCVTVDEPHRLDQEFEVPKFVNESGVFGVYDANHFLIVYEKPYCVGNDFFILEPLDDGDHIFQISETGMLYTKEEQIVPDEYCLEKLKENNFICLAVVCSRTDPSVTATTVSSLSMTVSKLQSKSIDIGMIISLPFLFSTFLTYAFIKELRSSWHVKFQMCHVASLSMAYMILIINKFLAPKMYQKNTYCLILAYTQQYFFIATFFWLNAMCFNIWWTLCKLKPIHRNKQKETKKFIKYSVYAWGCPFLISIITYFMDEIYSSSNFIRPEFGYNKCWFDREPAKWMYFYGPMAILLFSDLLMFIHTSKILFEKKKIGQEYFKETESSGSRKFHRQNFILYLKLFIITGGNWLAEIVSIATNSEGILWNFVDIGNALQGVFIFIIFICQKRVLTLLGQKLCSRSKYYHSQTTKKIVRNACLKTNTSIINEQSL